jgi:adenylate kinase family enzyme
MKISLIGMSEVGKTLWAKELEKKGFKRYTCDDYIEKKLAKELKPLGYSGIEDVAKWLGQPYENRYTKNSQRYLDLEAESMKEILAEVATMEDDEKVVIDTTGSIIYLDQQVIDEMKTKTKVIYLETPQSVQDEMYQLFLKFPKPLMWSDKFNMRADETIENALTRCYPELLKTRTEEYKKYADLTLDYFKTRKDNFTVDNFLELVLN